MNLFVKVERYTGTPWKHGLPDKFSINGTTMREYYLDLRMYATNKTFYCRFMIYSETNFSKLYVTIF